MDTQIRPYTILPYVTKIINIMKEQESGDSLLSQNSAELPDLELISEDVLSRENKVMEITVKRRKLLFETI